TDPPDADVWRAREGGRGESGKRRITVVGDELHPGAVVAEEQAGLVERQRARELEVHVDAVTDEGRDADAGGRHLERIVAQDLPGLVAELGFLLREPVGTGGVDEGQQVVGEGLATEYRRAPTLGPLQLGDEPGAIERGEVRAALRLLRDGA